ncbi:MAG TPA: HlyD family efflux transporter periplasmic adaptor subunit [Verrucomicrobiota bacterium]|nr:HlyD family efflux transporter periplasmic adaptor subunit [Verrucomicrobiota bacterium]HRZ37180.1 HlyD family efflux transporter periplasmic adaptor subunit [Candidatus Paceibacterota bacterium]
MDIDRPDLARARGRRRFVLLSGSGLAVVALTVGLAQLKPAAPRVEKAAIYTDTVKRGEMLRQVRGSGALVPEEIHWIPVTTAGRVRAILVLPGARVAADTVLVELSNPEIEHDVFEAEWQVKGAEAHLARLEVQLESERLAQEATAAALDADCRVAKLDAEADEKLVAEKLIDRITAMRSRTRADLLSTRCDLESRRLVILEGAHKAQIAAQEADLARLRATLELRQEQRAALNVRAGIDGVLQRLGDRESLQVGQQVAAGANLARVANPARLKAEIKVVETQAKDIQHGQKAEIDTRNGTVLGHVVRIDPAVINGTVTVDVALDGPLPRGARPDLSIEGTIELERLDDVLYVGRPVHADSAGTLGLFRLSPDGKEAVRIPVQLGRSSVSTVEIVSGLEVGDTVILSDMSPWDAHDRVVID